MLDGFRRTAVQQDTVLGRTTDTFQTQVLAGWGEFATRCTWFNFAIGIVWVLAIIGKFRATIQKYIVLGGTAVIRQSQLVTLGISRAFLRDNGFCAAI